MTRTTFLRSLRLPLVLLALLVPLMRHPALSADPPAIPPALIGTWQETVELKNYPGNYAAVTFDASGSFLYNGPGPFECKYSVSGNTILLTNCGEDPADSRKIRLVSVDGKKLILQWEPGSPLTNYRRMNGGGAVETTTPVPPTVTPSSGFVQGSHVQVQWQGQWYPATILKVNGDKYLIHYDNYDSSWDEWVTTDRLKK